MIQKIIVVINQIMRIYEHNPSQCINKMKEFKNCVEFMQKDYPLLSMLEKFDSLREDKSLLYIDLSKIYNKYENTNFVVAKLSNESQKEIVEAYDGFIMKYLKDVIKEYEKDC